MAKFNNTMEVFKLLEKTNCGKCNKKTCLVFAAAVFQGSSQLGDCPYIDEPVMEKYGNKKNTFIPRTDLEYEKKINSLKKIISETNLTLQAQKVGGIYKNNKLTIKILGKDFSVAPQGKISTDIHVNRWIAPVVYNHIINSQGAALTNEWISFRELKRSMDWYQFFNHQCIKELKKIADEHTNFFKNIIELFNGKQVEKHYDADISLIIHPLPKLPILICYNEPEDGLESELKLFFDSSVDKNFDVDDIYFISTGLTQMFQKLAHTHG